MLDLSEAQSATIISTLHSSLSLPLKVSEDTRELQLQAYISIISNPMNAIEALALGEAINAFILLNDGKDFVIDVASLRDAHHPRILRRALMYAGVQPIESGAKTVWHFGAPSANASVISIPADSVEIG